MEMACTAIVSQELHPCRTAAADRLTEFTDADILIERQEALATFMRSDVFKDAQSGGEIRLEVRVSSELTKQGEAWKIRGLKKPS